MKLELSQSTIDWQKLARDYADEYLQPHEVEATGWPFPRAGFATNT